MWEVNSAAPRKPWMVLQALGWQWCEPQRGKKAGEESQASSVWLHTWKCGPTTWAGLQENPEGCAGLEIWPQTRNTAEGRVEAPC